MNLNESHQKSGLIADLFNQRIQLELLFSTGAVVTLLNLPEWIIKELTILGDKSNILFIAFFQISQVFILAGIYALIIGFTLNIFFRILTLCYLGIDYVFPEGIIIDKLNFSEYAKQKILKNTETKKLIERTEQLAGFSFSFSILLVIKLLGLGIVFSLTIFTIESFGNDLFSVEHNKHNKLNLDNFFIIALLIVLGVFDYIVFVLLRRFNWLSKIYYPFYVFFNFISLNFLARKQSLILNSNFGRFKTGFLIILYLIIGIFLSNKNNVEIFDKRDFKGFNGALKNDFISRFYDDERGEDKAISLATLPSKYISSNFIPLFCPYKAWFDYDLEKFYQPDKNIHKDSLQLLDKEEVKRLDTFGKYLIVTLNDTLVKDLKWFYTKHAQTGQLGVLTHVPIKKLQEGQHSLGIRYNIQDGNKYIDKNVAQEIFINFIKQE